LLEFLLVVGNARGVDSAAVTLRIASPGADDPIADAGDPVQGIVGRPIRLDGSKSEPRGQILYKWIALAGPDAQPLRLEQDGVSAKFTPRVAGLYRFLLVVASGKAISDPDAVDVQVSPPPPPSIDQVAKESLKAVEGGPAASRALGEAFEDLAGRMDLYRTYADVQLEMSQRLEVIVPGDSRKRSAWAERVFVPLTSRLVEGLRAEGLDLIQIGGPAVPMSEAQKARLASMLRGISEGFRAVGAAP
jgi:hypothetical protein